METEDEFSAPFLIVTAVLSSDDQRAFSATLEALKIQIRASRNLFDWPRLSNALHPPRAAEEARKAEAYRRAWEAAGASASLWQLGGAEDFARLLAHKRALRRQFPSREVRIALPQGAVQVRLHSFHAPDQGEVRREWALVKALGLRPPAVGKEL